MPTTASKSEIERQEKIALAGYERELLRLYGKVAFGAISARNEDAVDAPIDALFVEPALSEAHEPPEAFDSPESGGADWKRPKTQALTDALLANPRLVILGDPGTGKSTAVQWITVSLAHPTPSVLRQRLQKHGEFTPIPIILRDLPPGLFTAEKRPEILWREILDAWLALPLGKWLASSEGLLDRLLAEGRAFVLIDGIDELPGLTAREALRDMLWWVWDHLRGCRWFATSRIIGYEEASVHAFTEGVPFSSSIADGSIPTRGKRLRETRTAVGVETEISLPRVRLEENLATLSTRWAAVRYLSPFDDGRVTKFSQQWFARLIGVEEEAEKEAKRFWDGLADKPDTRTLARVPNFLTLMALAWRSGLELPDGRAKLYRELSLAYLENIDRHKYRDRQRPMPPPLGATAEVMERWLGALAWHIQLQRQAAEIETETKKDGDPAKARLIVIERARALQILALVIAETTGTDEPEKKAEDFLLFASARSGLFLPRGAGAQADGQWGFLHLSFQEYFAACYLRDKVGGESWAKVFLYGRNKWKDPTTSVEALRDYADRRMWHETLLFLFELLGLGDPERPASRLRAILGAEDPTEPEWPALPPAEHVELFSPVGENVAIAEWFAILAVDAHISLAPADRAALLRRCWEWQFEWQGRVGPQFWIEGEGLAPLLLARRAALDLALPALTDAIVAGKPEALSLCSARALSAVPHTLLHPGLKQIVFLRCPVLTTLSSWPSMPRLQRLGIVYCAALSHLPTLPALPSLEELIIANLPALCEFTPFTAFPKLVLLHVRDCPNLTALPDLRGLKSLRHLDITGCTSLPPGTAARMRKELPGCEIRADHEKKPKKR